MYSKLRLICFVLVLLGFSWNVPSNRVDGQEIGFLEDYVLSPNREQVLKKLIPGTRDYYFYHCLFYQTNEQPGKVEEFLKPWIKRFGETARVKQIKHRQALLQYSDNPRATLAYLERELRLTFSHTRQIPQAQQDLPSRLDPAKIDIEKKLADALKRSKLDHLNSSGLRLVASKKLTRTQRRDLLTRVNHPDFPNLVPLVASDLQEKDSRGFGSLKVHAKLTLTQLDELNRIASRQTSGNANFINVYMSKLIPSDDVDWRADRVEYRKYLERLYKFVTKLSPSFNSPKHVCCIVSWS